MVKNSLNCDHLNQRVRLISILTKNGPLKGDLTQSVNDIKLCPLHTFST